MGSRKGRRERDDVVRLRRLLAAGEGEAAAAAAWVAAGGDDPSAVASWPAPLQVAVVEQAAEQGDARVLAALAAAPLDARGAKALRRMRHRLRNRGIDVPRPTEARPGRVRSEPDARSLLTDVDASGSRILLLARPSEGGVEVVEARDHVRQGLVSLRRTELSRREFRERVKRGLRERGVPFIEIDYATARELLVQSRERARGEGRANAAQAYAEAMLRFPRDGAPPRPGALAQLGAAEVDRAALREAARLHDLAEFQTWVIAPEALDRLLVKLQEVETSPLYINEAQKVEQRAAAFARAAEEYFDAPMRAFQAARLEAMADYLLWSERQDEARLALAVAASLADPAQDVTENAFAMGMVDKLYRQAGAAAQPAGLMVAPSDAEAPDRQAGDGDENGEGGGGLIVPP